ncbi:hypothetical protein [Ensifer sp. 1H6]|nr:hypothetical protein [Ensifer sp. 1H6]
MAVIINWRSAAAIVLSLVTFFTLRALSNLKEEGGDDRRNSE